METYIKGFSYFPENYLWSVGVLFVLGTSPWGSSDIGEVDRVGRRLKARLGDDKAWFEEWRRMGEEIERRAKEASSKKFNITASTYYLHACMYYQIGERYKHPKDREVLDVYRYALDCFKEGVQYMDHPAIEHVEIAFGGGKSLPALFVKASRDQNRPVPTVIFFDGLDATKEILYFLGVKDMVRRGLACLIVDGPGNGESIRFRGLHLRYDYEVSAGAAIDYLESRKDVDSNRIGVMGWSLGGYYVSRAAAFEKRIKACLACGGVWDAHSIWKSRFDPSDKTRALKITADQIIWVLGANSEEDALKRLEKFRLAGVAEKIECPFLLVHGENDARIPLEDARALFNAVSSKDKTLKVFTEKEGGSQHCQMDYLGMALPYMHDWLAEKLTS